MFFVRYRIGRSKRARTSAALTLVRRNGRFASRPTFYRPDSCGLLASASSSGRCSAGGPNRPLRVAFRARRRADVTVNVRRGKRVVRTIRRAAARARRTHRLRVAARALRAARPVPRDASRSAAGTPARASTHADARSGCRDGS